MSATITRWSANMRPGGVSHVAIGVFDGVHRGHQALIGDLSRRAHAAGVAAVVLTFDRDPESVVMPEQAAPQLLSLSDKLDALAATAADEIVVVPFDKNLAALSPERFVDEVLLNATAPMAIAVGEGFRFGAEAAGDVETLASLGSTRGFTVLVQPLETDATLPVSSTRIRSALLAGDIVTANRLLTRPHRLRGTVRHGRGEGLTLLGIPTANVRFAESAALPATGVYAGIGRVGDAAFPAAVSVGLAPSFADAVDVVEAHLVGYDGPTLYGTELVIDFLERIAEQRQFASVEELAEHIRVYIAASAAIARSWLRGSSGADAAE